MRESRPKARRTVVAGGLLLTLETDRPYRGDLYLEGDRIAAVCPPDPVPAWPVSEVERVEAGGLWVLPGLVQTHVHLCQTLFRGAAEGLPLYRWLEEVIWPLEAALEPETLTVSAETGILQLLAGGTTTILDMGTTRHTESVAAAAAAAGIRACLGPAIMDRGPASAGGLLRSGREFRAEIDALAERWDGYGGGRIRLALCPRFVPSVSDALFRELLREPAYARFPVHTHGAETRQEVEEVRGLTGHTPIGYLAALPGAEGRIRMAHGVWLTRDDRTTLRRVGASVLHCPGSNFKLGSGTADTLAMIRAGIPVGLGADGAPCNNRLDAWHEMRLAAYVQGLLHGPEAVDPAAILDMATREGARALGLESEIGTLRAGKKADFILAEPEEDEAALGADAEGESPESTLVFAASPRIVQETWVDGRRVHAQRDGRERRRNLIPRIREARRRLALRAGLRFEPPQPRPTEFEQNA